MIPPHNPADGRLPAGVPVPPPMPGMGAPPTTIPIPPSLRPGLGGLNVVSLPNPPPMDPTVGMGPTAMPRAHPIPGGSPSLGMAGPTVLPRIQTIGGGIHLPGGGHMPTIMGPPGMGGPPGGAPMFGHGLLGPGGGHLGPGMPGMRGGGGMGMPGVIPPGIPPGMPGSAGRMPGVPGVVGMPGSVPPVMPDPNMLAAMMSTLAVAAGGKGLGGAPAFGTLFQQPGMQQAYTTSDAASPADTKQHDGGAGQPTWKEHRTSEGRVFWHNAKTNKSTWDKPDELRTDLERILATSTSWREYPGATETDPSYWHNLETKISEWECPPEVQALINSIKELDAEDWARRTYSGKSEAKQEFRSFLERKSIGQKAKWEDVGKLLQSDKKWKTFDKWMTSGERKHAFNEYVNQLQKKVREEQRRRKGEARDALSEYLAKWRDGAEMDPMPPTATYELFEEKAGRQEWFHLLEVQDKAEAFEEMAGAVADDCIHRPSRAHQAEVMQFLEDLDETEFPILEIDPRKVVEAVRAACSVRPLPHPSVILTLWQTVVESYIEKRRKRVTRQLFRQERKNRAAFKQLLVDAEAEGLLDAKTEYRAFLEGPPPKKSRRRTTTPPDTAEADTAAPSAAGEGESQTDQLGARYKPKLDKLVITIAEEKKALVVKLREKLLTAAGNGHPTVTASVAPAPEAEEMAKESKRPNEPSSVHHREEGETTSSTATASAAAAPTRGAMGGSCSDEDEDDGGHAPSILTDSRYLRLFLQGGSTARDMFESYVDALWDDYEMVRPIFKKALGNSSFAESLVAIHIPSGKEPSAGEGGEKEEKSRTVPPYEQFRRIVEDQWDMFTGLSKSTWKVADRPGILIPLATSMIKRAQAIRPPSSSRGEDTRRDRRGDDDDDDISGRGGKDRGQTKENADDRDLEER